mmetsp:Transcript_14197/g.46349  ORF Transcript_14197/g.46349 Transcript_14197/m.46349 type:complete len:214 (-) Transcript_14197:205-846(-)
MKQFARASTSHPYGLGTKKSNGWSAAATVWFFLSLVVVFFVVLRLRSGGAPTTGFVVVFFFFFSRREPPTRTRKKRASSPLQGQQETPPRPVEREVAVAADLEGRDVHRDDVRSPEGDAVPESPARFVVLVVVEKEGIGEVVEVGRGRVFISVPARLRRQSGGAEGGVMTFPLRVRRERNSGFGGSYGVVEGTGEFAERQGPSRVDVLSAEVP